MKHLQSKERFVYWVKTRIDILNQKNEGLPGPWTDDPIFNEYHFTNVRREDDKVSKWLIENLYSSVNQNHWGIVLIARFINNINSLHVIKHDLLEGDWKNCKSKLEFLLLMKNKVFSSAYLQPEIKGMTRLEKIFDYLLPQVLSADIRTDSIEHAVEDLMKIKYLGEFISGQMAMDGMLFIDGLWSDKNTYAPMGPGSIRGLNRLLDRPLLKKFKTIEYRTNVQALAEELNLRALDIEHSLCEWDKYERLLFNDGSYKRFYKKDFTL